MRGEDHDDKSELDFAAYLGIPESIEVSSGRRGIIMEVLFHRRVYLDEVVREVERVDFTVE